MPTFSPGDRTTMPRTIQCPDCGVVLNVPEAAAGRRLKCPKCGTRFAAEGSPMASPPPSSVSGEGSSNFGRGSSTMIPTAASPSHGDFDLPTAPGSLREQFDLPLLGEDIPAPHIPIGGGPAADPMALFRDDPPSRRKPTSAEARSRARRCRTCGGVVPQGMSICSTCGLDQETGRRVDLMEDIDTAPGALRPAGPPMGVWIVGLIAVGVSLLFAVLSLVLMQRGETIYAFLLGVCGFGIYAALQFLRSKSVKLLLIALTLGVFVDVVALMVLPVFATFTQITIQDAKPGEDEPAIVNPGDQLDTRKLTWGIVILVTYFATTAYLNSPPVKRYFR